MADWREQALAVQAASGLNLSTTALESFARALEAADKGAREDCAQIAEGPILGGKVGRDGELIASAIRRTMGGKT